MWQYVLLLVQWCALVCGCAVSHASGARVLSQQLRGARDREPLRPEQRGWLDGVREARTYALSLSGMRNGI